MIAVVVAAVVLLFALVIAALLRVAERLWEMSQSLDALAAQIAANTDVEESAVQCITGLAEQVKTLAAELAADGQDTTKIDALAASVAAEAQKLGAAVTANTPAAPPAPAPDAPPA